VQLSVRVDLEDAASSARARPLLCLGFVAVVAVLIGLASLDVLMLLDDTLVMVVVGTTPACSRFGATVNGTYHRATMDASKCSTRYPSSPFSALLSPSSPLGSSYWVGPSIALLLPTSHAMPCYLWFLGLLLLRLMLCYMLIYLLFLA
jgi:hypothetical protein